MCVCVLSSIFCFSYENICIQLQNTFFNQIRLSFLIFIIFSEGPRRYFPQEASSEINLDDLERSEQSPVIFGAGLSFVLGAKRQRTHQTFR